MTREIYLFPLHTVLFPDGLLPLKVFEQRYIEMTKTCLRDSAPFGVCLIREGREVGAAARPAAVGCLADIVEWDMPHMGLFHLLARGGRRFRVQESRIAANQLVSATVEPLPDDPPGAEVDPVCGGILKTLIEKVGAERFPSPLRLEDATWTSYRLAEILPMEMAEKQELLELENTPARFERLRRILAAQGLSPPERDG